MSSYIPFNKGGGTMGMDTEDIITLTENKYVNERGDSMKGDLSMNAHRIREVSNPIEDTDATNRAFVINCVRKEMDELRKYVENQHNELLKFIGDFYTKPKGKESRKIDEEIKVVIEANRRMIKTLYDRLLVFESYINPTYSFRLKIAVVRAEKGRGGKAYDGTIEKIPFETINIKTKYWCVVMVVKIIDPFFYLFYTNGDSMKWFVKSDYNSRFVKDDVIIVCYDSETGTASVNRFVYFNHKVKSKNIIFPSPLVEYIDLIFYEKKVNTNELYKALVTLYRSIYKHRKDVRILFLKNEN